MRLDRRAAATLEFALVNVPFLGLVFDIATVSYNLYLQEALTWRCTPRCGVTP